MNFTLIELTWNGNDLSLEKLYVKIDLYIWNKFSIGLVLSWDFPGGSDGKESACNTGDLGSIPGLRRSPGEENGNPLQYSCLENPMDRETWWAPVHGIPKGWTKLNN